MALYDFRIPNQLVNLVCDSTENHQLGSCENQNNDDRLQDVYVPSFSNQLQPYQPFVPSFMHAFYDQQEQYRQYQQTIAEQNYFQFLQQQSSHSESGLHFLADAALSPSLIESGPFDTIQRQQEDTSHLNMSDVLSPTQLSPPPPRSDLFFKSVCDSRPISPSEWSSLENEGLEKSCRISPQFHPLNFADSSTFACLHITSHPGLLFIPISSSNVRYQFILEIIPHPLLASNSRDISSLWTFGKLNVTLMVERSAPRIKTTTTKKKKRKSPSEEYQCGIFGNSAGCRIDAVPSNLTKQYDFFNLRSTVDMSFSPNGCRPAFLQFECVCTDSMGYSFILKTRSDDFVIMTNHNQWQIGLFKYVEAHVFHPAGNSVFSCARVEHAPFSRLMNYIQLAYLDSKGFVESRFLTPREIKDWIVASAKSLVRFSRDIEMLQTRDIVSYQLFNIWFESARLVFYDLHTSAVGKIFQKLWVEGFISIGSLDYSGNNNSVDVSAENQYRLTIDTSKLEGIVGGGGGGGGTGNSYLSLECPALSSSYNLLELERDHLDYFFQHSRSTKGCTHLMSATNECELLPTQSLFSQINSTKKCKKK